MNKQPAKSMRDAALKAVKGKMKKSPQQEEAFLVYKKWADFLDDNFSQVKAEPQTASMPVVRGGIWGDAFPSQLEKQRLYNKINV